MKPIAIIILQPAILFFAVCAYAATYQVPVSHTLEHFDPAGQITLQEEIVINQIFDGLVTLTGDMHLVPALATKWDITDEGKTYHFTLGNAEFHDGSPVNSRDVEFTLKRFIKNGDSETLRSDLLQIIGASEFAAGTAQDISGFKIINDNEFTLTLKAPDRRFLYSLARNEMGIISRNSQFPLHPVGAGPYRLLSANATHTILKSFKNYRKGAPQIENLCFVSYKGADINKALQDFNNGELDELPVYGKIRKKLKINDLNTRSTPIFHLSFFGFNTKKAPTSQANTRHFLKDTIEINDFISKTWNNTVIQTSDFLPIGLPGANAQKHMEASASADNALNRNLTILYGGNSSILRSEMEHIKDVWSKQGFNIKIETITSQQNLIQKLRQGNYSVFRYSWAAESPDSIDFLTELVHSESPENYMGYNNTKVDALLAQAETEFDDLKRFSIIQNICAVLDEDLPYLPIFQMKMTRVYQPEISGQSLSPLGPAYVDYSTFKKAVP